MASGYDRARIRRGLVTKQLIFGVTRSEFFGAADGVMKPYDPMDRIASRLSRRSSGWATCGSRSNNPSLLTSDPPRVQSAMAIQPKLENGFLTEVSKGSKVSHFHPIRTHCTTNPIGELNFHCNLFTLLSLLPSVRVHSGF
jgi:hypothetical protein